MFKMCREFAECQGLTHMGLGMLIAGVALGYNTAFALFGGTAPLIATLLIRETGSKVAPSFYLVISATIWFLIFLRLRETYRDE